jgi:hypothetical protein
MHRYIFVILLIVTCGYAIWRGRRDERVVAIACLVATMATRFLVSPVSIRYSNVELGLVLVDLAMLATFITIALHSQRFWPLWVAGLQLTTSMSHLLKAIDWQLLPKAYGAAVALWSYPILIILAVGTWRSHQRRNREAMGTPAH